MDITATSQGMGHRARANGDEQDAYSRAARNVICALGRAGVVKATKARTHRRDRRGVRRQLAGYAG